MLFDQIILTVNDAFSSFSHRVQYMYSITCCIPVISQQANSPDVVKVKQNRQSDSIQPSRPGGPGDGGPCHGSGTTGTIVNPPLSRTLYELGQQHMPENS